MADVLLSDGTTVHLRPITPEDADAVVAMHAGFSERTRYLRYFSPYPRIPARDLARFVNVDHRDREAFVVATGSMGGEELIAVGRYERLGPESPEAEVAFVVTDDFQGRGIGSVLLEHLASAARQVGIERFVAEVLPANSAMLNVFADAGYEVSRKYADGVVHLVFPVAPTERSLAVQWDREHRTEAKSVARLMRPGSVAVYGASRSGRGVGAAVLNHLRESGYTGPIHAVRHPEQAEAPGDGGAASAQAGAGGGVEARAGAGGSAADLGAGGGVEARAGAGSTAAAPGGGGVEARAGAGSTAAAPGAGGAAVARAGAGGSAAAPGAGGAAVARAEVRGSAVAPGGAGAALGQAAVGGLGGVPVDLAVVAVPPASLDDVLRDAAEAGVHGLLVLTELDPPARQELLAKARAAGMRLVGPGSLGLADRWTPFNATMVPRLPRRGGVALFCQSGPLGLQLLAEADRRDLGVSSFVSVGRRADVSGNDMLQFWADDPQTHVIAMYLETFGNPRKFSRIARNVGRRKPILMIAGETGLVGSTLDASAMEALRAHSGVIEAETVAELVDIATILDSQPLPTGDRIGIVSNAFAFAALAAARVRMAGLTVGRVGSVGAGATPADLAAAVTTTLDSDDADAVIVAVSAPLPTGAMTAEAELFAPFAEAVAGAVEDADKPVVAMFLAGDGPRGVPTFRSVEETVRALRHVVRRAAWLREPVGRLPEARPVPAASGDIDEVLRGFGVPVKASRRVSDADAAVASAGELGFPVALKVADRPHRIDLGAVRLNLADEAMVRNAYTSFQELFGGGVEAVVQSMVAPGVACIVEALDDPAFGPVVGFGLGGPVTELVGDRAWRAAPLTDRDAAALVRAPRAAPLLEGTDLTALEELLVQIGQLMDRMPQLRRLVLNPVLAHASGLTVLHASGHLSEPLDSPLTRPDTGPRHLPH